MLQDSNGLTALDIAIHSENTECHKLLKDALGNVYKTFYDLNNFLEINSLKSCFIVITIDVSVCSFDLQFMTPIFNQQNLNIVLLLWLKQHYTSGQTNLFPD